MLAVSPVLQNPKVWVAEAAGKCEITQAQHNEVYACSFVKQMFDAFVAFPRQFPARNRPFVLLSRLCYPFLKYSEICRIHITCIIALWINLLFPSSF